MIQWAKSQYRGSKVHPPSRTL